MKRVLYKPWLIATIILIYRIIVSTSSVGQNNNSINLSNYKGYQISSKESLVFKLSRNDNNVVQDKKNPKILELRQVGVSNHIQTGKESFNKSGYQFYENTYLGINIPFACVFDSNGNTYITGVSSNVNSPEGNFITIKIDALGNKKWEKAQPGTTYAAEFGMVITIDDDLNPVASGTYWNGTNMDIQTVKYDLETGEVLWNKIFRGDGGGIDIPTAIINDNQGNTIITGITYKNEKISFLTIKYDTSGNLIWANTDSNTVPNSWSEPSAIDVDEHGNIVVAGFTENANHYACYYILKYDSQGNLLWKDAFEEESLNSFNSIARDVCFDTEGNCYITGTFNFGQNEIGTIKYNSAGEIQWVKTYKSGDDFTDGHSIFAKDSSIYVAGKHSGGWVDDGVVLISYDTQSNMNWIQETNDLIDISNAQLFLDYNNSLHIAGLGSDPTTFNRIAKVLKYSTDGTQQESITYSKNTDGTEGINDIIGVGPYTSNEISIVVDAFYSKYGNTIETAKISLSTAQQLWVNKYYNNGGSNVQLLNSFVDKDNNIYVTNRVGVIENNQYTENYGLIKYNDNGNIEWEKVFTKNEDKCEGLAAIADKNGNIVVYLIPNSDEGNPLVIKKYNTQGNLIWEYHKEMINPKLYKILIDGNNNIILTGNAKENSSDPNSVFTVIKFSNNGEELWTKYYNSGIPSDNIYQLNSVTTNSAGDVFITGAIGSGDFFSENINLVLLKFSENGEFKWMTPMIIPNNNSSGNSLLVDGANNIYVCGFIQDNITFQEKMTLTKFSDNGGLLWQSTYSETERNIRSYDLKLFSDNNLAVCGYNQNQADGVNRVVIVKFDSNGNQLWVRNTEDYHFYRDIYKDNANNLYVLSQAQFQTFPNRLFYMAGMFPLGSITKLDTQGNLTEELFIGPELSVFLPVTMSPLDDGRLLINGELSHELSFYSGIYFFQTSHTVTSITDNETDISSERWLGQNYPNPANTNTTIIPLYLDKQGDINISIFDIRGEQVYESKISSLPQGYTHIPIDVSSFKPGIYHYRVKTLNKCQSRKMIVL